MYAGSTNGTALVFALLNLLTNEGQLGRGQSCMIISGAIVQYLCFFMLHLFCISCLFQLEPCRKPCAEGMAIIV